MNPAEKRKIAAKAAQHALNGIAGYLAVDHIQDKSKRPQGATMKQVSFHTSKADFTKLNAIADRAVSMAQSFDLDYSKQDALMDLTAAHANGCPLDLDKLASADDGNFGHDVFGIRRHLNRVTGELEDCFLPRCAAPERGVEK